MPLMAATSHLADHGHIPAATVVILGVDGAASPIPGPALAARCEHNELPRR